MRPESNTPALLFPAALALAALTACGAPTSPPPPAPESPPDHVRLELDAPQWRFLELGVAERRAALAPLPLPARVDLDEKRTSSIGTPLAGRVELVSVRIGSRVKNGDRLFSVRSGAWAELAREREVAHTQVLVRQRVLERVRELFQLRAAAEKDVLAAEAELTEAQLGAKAADAKWQSLQVTGEGESLFWVRAPRAGTVVSIDVFTGQEVTPDRDKPLIALSDLAEVRVIADAPETDVDDLEAGQAVTIVLHGGKTTRPGVIEGVSEVVDPRRRTVEVRVRADNADRALRPNAFVEVVADRAAAPSAITVPEAAVVTWGARLVVFVLTSPGRLDPVDVVTGRRRDGLVEIRSGLEEGARVVTKGALLLLNQIELASG